MTVWDLNRYGPNDFLGEVLLDLDSILITHEANWYTLKPHEESGSFSVSTIDSYVIPLIPCEAFFFALTLSHSNFGGDDLFSTLSSVSLSMTTHIHDVEFFLQSFKASLSLLPLSVVYLYMFDDYRGIEKRKRTASIYRRHRPPHPASQTRTPRASATCAGTTRYPASRLVLVHHRLMM